MTTLRHEDLRDRSTAALVKQLSRQASTLVRQEIELAKTELAEKAKSAGAAAAALGAAGVAGLMALGAFTAFLVLVLATALAGWLAALLVALLWAVVAGALALFGRQKVQEAGTPVPEKTVETVKEDIEWLKHPTS